MVSADYSQCVRPVCYFACSIERRSKEFHRLVISSYLFRVLTAARRCPAPDSTLAGFLSECTPQDRVSALEASEDIEAAYSEFAHQGASVVPDAEDEVDFHYICFVKSHNTGKLYEMDGDKKGPVYKEVTLGKEEDVVSDSSLRVIREYIGLEKGSNLNFSLMALAPVPDDSA